MSGAHIATQAARRRRAHQEEESMSPFTPQDREGAWEFKIIRTASGTFKDPNTLAEILQLEALAGWELFEKFDDHRLRLKRPTLARRNDGALPPGLDPYRTQYGLSEGSLAALIVGATLALSLGVVLLVYLYF